MTTRTMPTVRAIGLAALMGVTLLVLAVLQYRWIGEVSQGERTRLRVSLENAVQQFRTEFNTELRRMCLAFELDPRAVAARRWDLYAQRYDEWTADERHARLVESVFLLTQQAGGAKDIRRLDGATGEWVPVEWTERLESLRRQMDRRASTRLPPAAVARISLWRALAEDLVLFQPLVAPDPSSGASEIVGFLAIELNRQYFQEAFLPEMLRRYFRGREEIDFDVAVVAGRQHRQVICATDSQLTAGLLDAPDLRSRIFWERADLPQSLSGVPSSRPDAPAVERQRPAPGLALMGPRFRRPPVLFGGEANDWEIVARFRGGSLEEIVSKSRRRTLAVSFGVLLLLGVGMSLIVWGARRSHQLAELQMRFVAGVSHDLRTPLAVICSAADNLAAGVVGDSTERVKEYGSLIRAEGRKLSSMIEQILRYASLQSRSVKADLKPCSVRELVEAVLSDESQLVASLGIKVLLDIPGDLPAILCDRAALRQALGNLVSNSLKHAASGRWLRIHAAQAQGFRSEEVAISVEDRGPGIDSEDLPRVFEPFFRGRNASASGVPGSGLGLSVVRQSMSAMGGRVTARSAPGIGSTFTLYLPSAGRVPAVAEAGS